MNDGKRRVPLTRADLDEDFWNAVHLPLPENPDSALLEDMHWMAKGCYEAALDRIKSPPIDLYSAFEPELSRHPDYWQAGGPADYAAAALERLKDLEKLDPTLRRGGRFPSPDDSRYFVEDDEVPDRAEAEEIDRFLDQQEKAGAEHEKTATPERDRNSGKDSERIDRLLNEGGSETRENEEAENIDPQMQPGFFAGGRGGRGH